MPGLSIAPDTVATNGPPETAPDAPDASRPSESPESAVDASEALPGPPPELSPDTASLLEVIRLNKRGIELHDAWQSFVERAKDAKKRWEGHQEYIQKFVAGLDMPLFDKGPDGSAEADAPPTEPAPDPAWRSVPLLELGRYGLAPKLREKLAEAGISTVGTLADWTNGGQLLTDIPGVGAAAAGKIEDVLAEFWEARPELVEGDVSGVETDADPAPEDDPS